MLNIQLGKIVSYANKDKSLMQKAVTEFFGETPLDKNMQNIEAISGLFNEWLIFDFKRPSGTTFVTDYYFKNPDSLSEGLLEELKQVIETQHFDMLELQSLKRGEWLKVYGLLSGKKYTVYEHTGSLEAPEKGMFWGRIAKVNNKYMLVGSNPLYYPVTASTRLKEFYHNNKPETFSPKDVLSLVLPQKPKPSMVDNQRLSPHELKKKKDSIKKRFDIIRKEKSLSIAFKDITAFVYNENYKSNFADFLPGLVKLGIPGTIVFSNPNLFNDLWNFFPHKLLNGKSPYEMFKHQNK